MKIVLSNIELSESATKRLKDSLQKHGYEIRTEQELSQGEKEHVEILLHQRGERWLTKEKIGELPHLKLVQTFSAGVDHINFEVLPDGITVCGNVGAFADPIAEHVFGFILILGKRLFHQNESLKHGYYDHRMDAMFLRGKKIGILGAGGIGQAVAKLAKSFRMTTLGINTTGIATEYFDEMTTMKHIDDVLSRSDIVLVSLPLSAKTKGLIDKEKLRKMKQDCILINVARAEIIVEEDLYNHLKNHPEFRAGFDVWWARPKPDHSLSLHFPFFELSNFIGTPHVAGDV